MMDVPVLSIVPLCILVYAYRRWKKSTVPYPPSPRGYPLIGNVLDLATGAPIWESLASLADREDTDVLHLNLMGEDMIVLNSAQAISDLVDKRSGMYADRPQPPMVELTGVPGWSFAAMPYGNRWRVRRRLCHEVLNERLVNSFNSTQYKYTYRFLSRLLENPGNFMEEVDILPGTILLSVTYGIDVQSSEDPFLRIMLEATEAFAAATVPGRFLVNNFPILRYLPDWFPGTGFKTLANEALHKFKPSVDGTLEFVKKAMKSGDDFSQSITSDCLSRLEDEEKTNFDEEVVRDVSGVMFGAGAETTRLTMQTFLLAMVLYPKVLKKAQAELDRVVGHGRLPDYSDREDLPYIEAIMKEVLRWNPPLPIAIPTRVTQDDVYRGYFIPEGATIVQNVWAVTRDEKLFPDPETFNPDRYLKDGKIDPTVFSPEERVFGGGRRICPGKHFALRTFYLFVSSVSAVFDIEPAVNEHGNPLIPEPDFFGDSTVRGPKPFNYAIKPRSKEVMKLVKEAYDRVSH